jgi:type IV pilus assembly protein PilC
MKRPRRSEYTVLFCRHLATATKMGLPLHKTVEVLAQEIGGWKFSSVLARVAERLGDGLPLSEAIAPETYFPMHMRRLIAVGESGNCLPEALADLAVQIESSYRIRDRLLRAFVYPGIVSVLLFGDLLILSVYVVPQFVNIYLEMGGPGTTVPLYGFLNYALYALSVLIGVIALLCLLLIGMQISSRISSNTLHKIARCIPIIGRIHRSSDASLVCRTLGILLAHHVPLTEAMDLTGYASGSEAVSIRLDDARSEIEGGVPLSSSLQGGFFPPTLAWMLTMAEEKGEVAPSLMQMADHYENQTETSLLFLRDTLEPILIVCIGLIVAMAVSPIFMAIFDIYNLVS